eukprot:evm.model.scf_1913.5 EVM.evm.TU.scf_1913.5   scf_1913:27273-28443(-)
MGGVCCCCGGSARNAEPTEPLLAANKAPGAPAGGPPGAQKAVQGYQPPDAAPIVGQNVGGTTPLAASAAPGAGGDRDDPAGQAGGSSPAQSGEKPVTPGGGDQVTSGLAGVGLANSTDGKPKGECAEKSDAVKVVEAQEPVAGSAPAVVEAKKGEGNVEGAAAIGDGLLEASGGAPPGLASFPVAVLDRTDTVDSADGEMMESHPIAITPRMMRSESDNFRCDGVFPTDRTGRNGL